jgi:malate permease and related proteins
MILTIVSAYQPLILWTGIGLIFFRFIPENLPKFLGKCLYWLGIPLQIFALTRRTDFAGNVGFAPLITVLALALGWLFATLILKYNKLAKEAGKNHVLILPNRSSEGSFILSAMLGNTGFIGLSVIPLLLHEQGLSWAVFYNFAQSVIGNNGIGVFLASYFSSLETEKSTGLELKNLLKIPSLWAFLCGYLIHDQNLPNLVESGLQNSLLLIVPMSFLLMGMRLGKIQGWKSLKTALLPALIKVVISPAIIGLGATLLGLTGEARLTMVLMAGMPTAFVGLIIAEEYDLDREIIASSIVVSTVMLLVMIPVWLLLF